MKKKSDILKTTVTNEMGLPYSRPEMGSIDPHLNSSSKSCSEALNDGMHSHCSKHSCQGSGIEMLSDSTHCHCKEHKGMNKCSKLLNDSAHPHANDEMCQSDCGKMLSDINHLHVNRQKCSCCKMFSDSAQPHFNDHKCSSSCNEVLSNDAHSLLTVQKCHSKEFTGKMHHPCSRQECPNNYSETLSDNSSTHPDLNSKECLCDCSETEEATVGFYGPSSNSERDNDRCSTDEANANQESSSERNNDHCSRDTSTIHGSNSERENDRCSKDERHPRHDNNSERYNDHCSKETNASQDSSSEKENDHCSKDETNASHDGNTEKENDHCSKDETNTRQDSNSERENDSCSSDETNTRHDRNSEKDNVCCSKDGTNVSHNGNSERENDHCGKDEKNASQDSSSERQNDNCSRGETNTRQDSNSVRENGHCSKDETNTSQGSKYETNVSHNRNSERENDCIIKDETNTSQDSSSERKNDRYRREDTVNDCPSNKMDNDQSSNNKSDNKHYSKDERDSNYHSNSDCSAGSQEELTNEVAAQSTYDKDAYVMLDEMDADDDSEDLRYRSDHFMGGAAEILGQMMSAQPLDWEDDVDDPVEQAMAKYKVNRTNDNNKTRPSSAQEASELSAVQQRGQGMSEQPWLPGSFIQSVPFIENNLRHEHGQNRFLLSCGEGESGVRRDQEGHENIGERRNFERREIEGRGCRERGKGSDSGYGERSDCEERDGVGERKEYEERRGDEDDGTRGRVERRESEDRPSLRRETRESENRAGLRGGMRENEDSASLRGETRENEDRASLRGERRENEGRSSLKGVMRESEDRASLRGETRESEDRASFRGERRDSEDRASLGGEGRESDDKISFRGKMRVSEDRVIGMGDYGYAKNQPPTIDRQPSHPTKDENTDNRDYQAFDREYSIHDSTCDRDYKTYDRGCNYDRDYNYDQGSSISNENYNSYGRNYGMHDEDHNVYQLSRGASSLTSLSSDEGSRSIRSEGRTSYRGGNGGGYGGRRQWYRAEGGGRARCRGGSGERYDGSRVGYRGGRGQYRGGRGYDLSEGRYSDGGRGGYEGDRNGYSGGERGQYRGGGDRGRNQGRDNEWRGGNRGDGGRSGGGEKDGTVVPWLLVEVLAEYPDFRASLLSLMERKEMHPSRVRETVAAHSHIFQLHGEYIELQPDLGLCVDHAGPQGCRDRSACPSLHLCPSYVRSWCQERECTLGHRWFTDHNKRVLRAYYLERLPCRSLRNLVRDQLAAKPASVQLDVCQSYNNQGCSTQDCPNLHVCLSFVKGLTKCEVKDCRLNHNLLAADCCQLLRAQGISTNEAPRDIAMALKHTCPSLATNSSPTHNQHTTTTAHKPATFQGLFTRNSESWQPQVNKSDFSQNSRRTTSDNTSGTRGGGRGFLSLLRQTLSSASSTESASSKNQGSFKNTDTSSKGTDSTKVSSRTNGEADSGRKGDRGWSRERGSESSGAGRQGGVPAKKEKTQTVWSHYLYGDTEINEICYYSVEGQCRNESTGCQRLHSAQHFHWQVSEQGSKWLNLRPFQSTCLERAYCDPGQDGANIPRLDPSKLSQSLGKLLTVLGRETWQANFEAMILHNSDQSQLLYIRRLCTQYIPGQKVPASVHSWYFRDKNNKWVKYGNVDTAGETKLVSSVTSADIERHYWTQKQQPLTFKNASYTYVLDFVAMTQKNQNTKVKREVRRRPEPHIRNNDAQDGSSQKSGGHMSDGKASSSKAASDSSLGSLPSFWNPMQPEERLRMVTVPSGSSEYRSVAGLLGSNSGNLVKVERIQNPFVWRALQNKIRDMTLTYRGDIKKVDVRQLFHGTKPDVVASICAENFDWRLHGTSTGQASGRGTYFSPNFNTSYRYCHPDSSGHKYIFVARVAVGSITQGNSSTVRPPINPATGHPYESTGDGVSVVVKYDKQEYCPEYLLTLQ